MKLTIEGSFGADKVKIKSNFIRSRCVKTNMRYLFLKNK